MALEYDLDRQLKELSEISSEYLGWFLAFNYAVLFEVRDNVPDMPDMPDSFLHWAKDAQGHEPMDQDVLQKLNAMYKEIVALAQGIALGGKPDAEIYQKFTRKFEHFIDALKRVEKDVVLFGTGLDPLTGLRSNSVMKKDLKHEMDRLSRQGRPFCIALARIDRFDDIVQEFGMDHAHKYMVQISDMIKQSMRSFDDAYRFDDSMFLLSLKQADISGGIRGLDRLRLLLEEAQIVLPFQSGKASLSLSCCVAEPVVHDDIDDLIRNLKEDLKNSDIVEGDVLEYYEASALQRYAEEH